ncbi:hypothetical protein ACSVDE_07740 [Pseudalkalibacillus sp. Hm43]|uniref:hypothetical protein n=1 Tax=Pseudalkalibacillus sp. Hm43 TaxID=3450742 RepID=UPI003F425621
MSVATIALSGILLGSFVRRTRDVQSGDADEDRRNRELGQNVVLFGLPFIAATIFTTFIIY